MQDRESAGSGEKSARLDAPGADDGEKSVDAGAASGSRDEKSAMRRPSSAVADPARVNECAGSVVDAGTQRAGPCVGASGCTVPACANTC